ETRQKLRARKMILREQPSTAPESSAQADVIQERQHRLRKTHIVVGRNRNEGPALAAQTPKRAAAVRGRDKSTSGGHDACYLRWHGKRRSDGVLWHEMNITV